MPIPDMLLAHVVMRAVQEEPEPEAATAEAEAAVAQPEVIKPERKEKEKEVDSDRFLIRDRPGGSGSGRPDAGREPVRQARRRAGAPPLATVKLVVGLGNPGTKYQGHPAQYRLRAGRPPGTGRVAARRSPASSTACSPRSKSTIDGSCS